MSNEFDYDRVVEGFSSDVDRALESHLPDNPELLGFGESQDETIEGLESDHIEGVYHELAQIVVDRIEGAPASVIEDQACEITHSVWRRLGSACDEKYGADGVKDKTKLMRGFLAAVLTAVGERFSRVAQQDGAVE